MNITKTQLEGVLIIEPQIFHDERGYFFESYSERTSANYTLPGTRFVQDNESRSSYGVIRGLHYQTGTHAQSKLVRVVCGAVLDVVVDIRRASSTFGKHICVELSAENHRQLFIPKGFAHGYAALSDSAVFQYKCDNFYHPQSERGIRFDDPALAIDWTIPRDKAILSPKDMALPFFNNAELP